MLLENMCIRLTTHVADGALAVRYLALHGTSTTRGLGEARGAVA